MSEYKQIASMNIKNFRNLGDVTIDFTESPIISLVGENESGKTSVVKAFSVVSVHDKPRDQKDYIRDGTNGFRVSLTLDDGTVVHRTKIKNGENAYDIVYPDGRIWQTDKLSEGLPSAVEELMGITQEQETKELLQIRTYEDRLLFVVTQASLNYKVMYDALKVGDLSRAIKSGSNEINALKNSINTTRNGIVALTMNLNQFKEIDIEPVLEIRDKLTKNIKVLNELKELYNLKKSIEDRRNELGNLREFVDNVKSGVLCEINENLANNMYNMIKHREFVNKLRLEIKGFTSVDKDIVDIDKFQSYCTTIDRLEEINKNLNTIHSYKNELNKYKELDSVKDINMELLNKLVNIYDTLKDVKELRSKNTLDTTGAELVDENYLSLVDRLVKIKESYIKVNEISSDIKVLKPEIESLEEWMKASGAEVYVCPNCGETIVV